MSQSPITSSGTDLDQLRAEFEAVVLSHFGEGETFERDKDGCYINRSWHDAFIGFHLARRASTQPVAVDAVLEGLLNERRRAIVVVDGPQVAAVEKKIIAHVVLKACTAQHPSATPSTTTHDYDDPTLACSSCGLTMGESRTLGHIKLGILNAAPSAQIADAQPNEPQCWSDWVPCDKCDQIGWHVCRPAQIDDAAPCDCCAAIREAETIHGDSPHADDHAGDERAKPCGWLAGSGTEMAEDMYYRLKDAQEECDRHNDYERSHPDFDPEDLRTPKPVYRYPPARQSDELRKTPVELATVQRQLIDANAEIAAFLIGAHPALAQHSSQPAQAGTPVEQWRLKGTTAWYDVDAADKEATLGTHTGYEKRTLYTAPIPPQADNGDADELKFNATRLRNVARLVGLESAVPQDDETLDGARGSVLGMIAGKLRLAADNGDEAARDALDAARYRWLREQPFDTWKRIAWNTWNDEPAVFPIRDADIDAAIRDAAQGGSK